MKVADKDQAKSFISEHTAEYVLIPNMKSILQKEFSIITPIFPWATREGSTLARHLHKGERFQVVGLYPRRPKLLATIGSTIIVKLNRQIIIGAQSGIELGIPIIAGCPLAKNFWELGSDPTCLWIELDRCPVDDLELEVEHVQSHHFTSQMSGCILPNNEELLAYLTERSRLMDFDSATLAFKSIKLASEDQEFGSYFGMMRGYKPVYFLLK